MKQNIQTVRQILIALLVIALVVPFTDGRPSDRRPTSIVPLAERVMPPAGVTLPIAWGDMGHRMIAAGVIDVEKFESLYSARGGMSDDMNALLYENKNDAVTINRENANEILNLLWAFGLSNKNPVLEKGPMTDPQYGAVGRFASTAGWILAKGNAMNHYSMHSFVVLSDEEQEMVERVSKNIYRPCCGNSTYFPDCNHGMAMLGLLELLAANGVSEEEMYDTALAVNSYWFPDTYLTLATYVEQNGTAWESVDPRVALGKEYSSGAGYRNILEKITPVNSSGGESCSA